MIWNFGPMKDCCILIQAFELQVGDLVQRAGEWKRVYSIIPQDTGILLLGKFGNEVLLCGARDTLMVKRP